MSGLPPAPVFPAPLRTLRECEHREPTGLLGKATSTTRSEVEPRPPIDDRFEHELAEERLVQRRVSEVLDALDSTL